MIWIGSGAKGLCKELQLVGNQFLTPLICGVPANPRTIVAEAAIGGEKKNGKK